MRVGTVGLGLLLQIAPAAAAGVEYQLSADEIAMVQADIRMQLKDPDSAKFGGMAAARQRNNTVTVCGWVNAKNSFGGFTGFLPYRGEFSLLEKRFYLFAAGGLDSDVYDIVDECNGDGVSIPKEF